MLSPHTTISFYYMQRQKIPCSYPYFETTMNKKASASDALHLFCFYFFRFRDAAFLPGAESFLTLHPNVPRVFSPMSGILRENMPEVRPFPAVVFPFIQIFFSYLNMPLLLPETYDAKPSSFISVTLHSMFTGHSSMIGA